MDAYCDFSKDIPLEKIPANARSIMCPKCKNRFDFSDVLPDKNQVTIVTLTKSMGISIILTILFGPLGMFYSTIGGAIVMIFVSLIVALFTLGVGLLITWPICIIWGAVSVNSYNQKLLSGNRPY